MFTKRIRDAAPACGVWVARGCVMCKAMYEFLVPVVSNAGVPFKNHETLYAYLRLKFGGVTVAPAVEGQWLSPTGRVYIEPMIPVQVIMPESEVVPVATLIKNMFEQEGVCVVRLGEAVIA